MCRTATIDLLALCFHCRQLRVQKEAVEAAQRKQEVILQREQEMETLIEAKAQEVMQLEVRGSRQNSVSGFTTGF